LCLTGDSRRLRVGEGVINIMSMEIAIVIVVAVIINIIIIITTLIIALVKRSEDASNLFFLRCQALP